MRMKRAYFTYAVVFLVLLASCSALRPTPETTQAAPTKTVQPATGIEYRFVTDKLLLPTTPGQSREYALDVDGDAQGHADNLFGTLLTLLASAAPQVDLQETVDQALESGQIVSLHQVKEDNPLDDPSVSWTIFQGQKSQTPPKFDGTDKFMLNADYPVNLPIVGSLTNGHFTGGPGSAQIQIYLLGQMIDINLIGVRLEADFSVHGCANGKMGGGVTIVEFQEKLLPAIAEGLNQIIKSDPSAAKTLLSAFDTDQSGTISVQELETNAILMIAASPDLDLQDASGKFNPGQDGVKDSYSVGLGFSCVAARFAVPGD